MDATNAGTGMMTGKNEVCFNELSLFPLCSDKAEVEKRMRRYAITLKELSSLWKIKKVRYHENMVNIPLTMDMTLQQYCEAHRHDPLATLLLSTFTMPQVDENDEIMLEQYCDTHVSVHKEGECVNSHGFNAAYCQSTFCIGFQSEAFWTACLFKIIIGSNEECREVEWACLSHPGHAECGEFRMWYEATLQTVVLQESEISYEDKIKSHLHLRNDHGKDLLEEHAKRLLRNQYVNGVVNSLPFNKKSKRYILQVKDDGIINIVLYWTDAGYGMAIQTTGRNIRETKLIAEILEKEYGNK